MEADLLLINKIKQQNDNLSLQQLIDRHSGIYMDIVNKIISDSCDFVNKMDVIADKDYTIYNAALKYNPNLNTKFPTYLANETRWKCLNLYNKNKKRKEDPLEYYENDQAASNDFIKDLENSEILKKFYKLASSYHDKRVKKIIDMRYGSSYNKLTPWKSIAKKLKMSIQGCINIHNKFIEQTKKELENV
jgi:DNA-directed RNA polymerase specialized sigma subunit